MCILVNDFWNDHDLCNIPLLCNIIIQKPRKYVSKFDFFYTARTKLYMDARVLLQLIVKL